MKGAEMVAFTDRKLFRVLLPIFINASISFMTLAGSVLARWRKAVTRGDWSIDAIVSLHRESEDFK